MAEKLLNYYFLFDLGVLFDILFRVKSMDFRVIGSYRSLRGFISAIWAVWVADQDRHFRKQVGGSCPFLTRSQAASPIGWSAHSASSIRWSAREHRPNSSLVVIVMETVVEEQAVVEEQVVVEEQQQGLVY